MPTAQKIVAEKLLDLVFDAGEFDVATIFFNRFVSVINQESPRRCKLIPATVQWAGRRGRRRAKARSTTTSPDEEEILADLLPRSRGHPDLRGAPGERVRRNRGPGCPRWTTRPAMPRDMIDRLTIEYNRSRQAAITKELIEIISGAEAL